MPENQSVNAKTSRAKASVAGIALLIVFSPVLLLVGCLYAVLFALVYMLSVVWRLSTGVRTIFVYSDSPNWREYCDSVLIPALPKEAVVLNWSRRKGWRWYNIAAVVYNFHAAWRDYCPVGLTFTPLGFVKTHHFFGPFKKLKHGNAKPLQEALGEYFSDLHANPPVQPTPAALADRQR